MAGEWEPTRTLLRRLRWSLVHPLATRLNGDERSRLVGAGVEFAGVREYQPGDDIRRIDWNLTARSNTPFIREAQADGQTKPGSQSQCRSHVCLLGKLPPSHLPSR